MRDVLVFIPAWNEEGNLPAVLDDLRAAGCTVLPAALDGPGARAHVGGLTAVFIDLSDTVARRLPVFVAAVVGLSFLLLMAVFRSVLVPLKAALMNLLSIGAAYGVVVAVFQWGWGASLIGLDGTVPIVSFVPMFMFAVLFGGVTALLPIYARDILDAGPEGLGILRSSPAIGALLAGLILTQLPPMRRSGVILYVSVAIFGLYESSGAPRGTTTT